MQNNKINDYAQYRNICATVAGKIVTFTSKPGIEDWEHVRPSELLIADLVLINPLVNVALFGCRHGAIPAAVALANPTAKFTCVESNVISIHCINQTIANNEIDNVKVHQFPFSPQLNEGSFQVVIILIPKGRNLARRWILEALTVLEPGGILYIGGATDTGIKSIIKDAAGLFTNTEILGYKKGERIARFSEKKSEKSRPVWTSSNGIAPGTWFEFEVKAGEYNFKIHSLPGVFSADHFDEGSSLLFDNIEIPEYARVLDIGCGYGIIGMAAAKKQATAKVDMVDVDLMAVTSSIENIKINGLTNIHVFASDLLNACTQDQYQLIVSNPPFHTGKETNYLISEAMIEQAYSKLAPGGEFTLVANRFLRYEKQMQKYFSRVFIRAQTNRYHIISGVR